MSNAATQFLNPAPVPQPLSTLQFWSTAKIACEMLLCIGAKESASNTAYYNTLNDLFDKLTTKVDKA